MNSREMSLGKVSVVQMAMAVVSQWSKVEPRAAWDLGMPPVILSMGSLREVSWRTAGACPARTHTSGR